MRWHGIALVAILGAAGAEPDKPEEKAKAQRIEAPALGLEATFDLPDGWSEYLDTGADGFTDSKTRAGLLKAKELPNDDFEVERGWENHGEVLAQMRLRLGCKEFRGTTKELADRCVSEIRAKWRVFKATRPVQKDIKLHGTPALLVKLENPKEPPYRVQFVVLVAEGKGCGLFCYGWGTVVNVVDTSGAGVPDSIKKIAEEARRLSPEKLKRQAELFREFETVIVPTLRVAKPKPNAEAPTPDPER
ncbi:MAG TPA: hypothetical protein VFY93_11330 [Planctomycetota bacterium]|nr:hypothetical protein [Planctomycetota bacterium]